MVGPGPAAGAGPGCAADANTCENGPSAAMKGGVSGVAESACGPVDGMPSCGQSVCCQVSCGSGAETATDTGCGRSCASSMATDSGRAGPAASGTETTSGAPAGAISGRPNGTGCDGKGARSGDGWPDGSGGTTRTSGDEGRRGSGTSFGEGTDGPAGCATVTTFSSGAGAAIGKSKGLDPLRWSWPLGSGSVA